MKEKVNVYLDDLRDCPKGFLLAKNIYEAIDILENNQVRILSLDHDLGMNQKTKELLPSGYDLVKYFCQNGLYADKIYIHTDNPVGRENMYKTLLSSRERGFINNSIRIYNYPYTPNKYSIKWFF